MSAVKRLCCFFFLLYYYVSHAELTTAICCWKMDCIYTLFSNQWPLNEYHITSHSPIHAHIHSATAVSTMQSDSQLVRSSLGEASCSGTPRHSARRSQGSNLQPSGYQPTRSTSWATCLPLKSQCTFSKSECFVTRVPLKVCFWRKRAGLANILRTERYHFWCHMCLVTRMRAILRTERYLLP